MYLHRSAALRVGLLDSSATQIPRDYNIVKVKSVNGGQGAPVIEFIKSPDFDTALEPKTTNRLFLDVATGEITRKPLSPANSENPPVLHHKWVFVFPDYKGFDYDAAVERSRQILDIGYDAARVGRERPWQLWREENGV